MPAPASADCEISDEQQSWQDGENAGGDVAVIRTCDGAAGSTDEQRWAAFCSPFGDWSSTNTVNLIKGEEVESGDSVNVGDVTQPITDIGSPTPSFRWAVQCTNAAGQFFEYSIVLPAGQAPVDPIDVRNQALAKLTIPDPELGGSPPLDDPDRFSVVRIPTWLWITHPWDRLTASASDGGVSVSVAATPVGVTWDPGDGTTPFVCGDAGRPWRKGMDEADASCAHTFTTGSAGQPDNAFRLAATVTWVLTWSINTIDQGQFGTYEPTLTINHQVGEIQAVGS